MRYVKIITLLTLASTALVAQPVITRDDMMIAGDNYAVANVASVPEPGSGGAGMLWDFSDVAASAPTNYSVVQPGMTPYAGTFPSANLAFVSQGGGLYQYQNLSSDVLEEWGYVVPGFSTLTYQEGRRYLELPVTYNDQWNSGYEYEIAYQTNPPITTFGEGAITAVVDAYGTLILPQGTFTDALRIAITGSSTDTTELGFNLYERNYFFDTTYLWLSPSYHAPLCTYVSGSLVRYTTVAIGDTTVVEETDAFMSFSLDPTAEPGPAATRDLAVGNMHMQVSPNPMTESAWLSFQANESDDMTLELRDAGGVLILSKIIHAGKGANSIQLDLPAHTSGLFIAALYGSQGIGVLKLMSAGTAK